MMDFCIPQTSGQDFQTPSQHIMCTRHWKKLVVSKQINIFISDRSLDLKRIMDNYWSNLGLYYFVEHYLGQKRRTDMLTKSRIMDRQDVFSFI